ncbi:MAG: TonB-dependent receptor [Polyangiaceae bacterium]|nr:TonB-dependent receptor [Polyangiaceae bacterium]
MAVLECDIHYRIVIRRRRARSALLLGSSVLCVQALGTPSAFADEPAMVPTEEPAEQGVEVVVTGTRAAENRAKSVVPVGVVTRKDARERGATNVGEALSQELGVEVNAGAYGSLGGPSAAQIGGFDKERVLVMEDGERVVGDVGGAIDLSQLDLSSVERIELVQGPSSALYGSSAIGGVINVVTAPPEREGWSGRAQLEGRYRWGGFALGGLAFRANDAWISADASFYGSEGVSLAPPDTAIPDLYRVGATLRAGTRVARIHDVSFRLRYGREASKGVDAQEVPGLGTFLLDLPDVAERLSVRLQEKLELAPHNTLSISLGKQWFWNETKKDRVDSPLDEIRERFHTMHSAEVTGSFLEGEMLSFMVGGRGEIEQFDQTLTRSTVVHQEVETTSLVEVVPTQLTTGAAYAQLRFDPWEELSVVAGGRVEGSDRYGAAVAPRVAVAVRPYDKLSLRLSGGRGYRAPSAKEIGFIFDHSVYGYRVIGNPDLTPETSWGVQGDAEWRPVRALSLRVSGYANWVEDLIDLRPKGTSSIAGVDDYTYVNVGEARTSGVEAKVRVRANPWISAEAGYSYLFTRDEEAARPLPGRPPHTLLAAAKLKTPIGLSFVGRIRAVTSAYLDDETRTPPFATLDLRLAQRTWPGGEAYVGALNLIGYEKDPQRYGDQRPVEGRTFYLGVSAELPPEESP